MHRGEPDSPQVKHRWILRESCSREAMSHLNPGLISAYNSLTDKHLAGYFSNTRIRRHLQRAGLITRSGRIVPDKEYRHKLFQRAQQRHIRECLAQAIFHKVLEMERIHQIEIKRKLEEFARRERVHKIKVERSKRYEEEIIRILSPRPPTGARGVRPQHSGPEAEHSESSESLGSSRPNTAPGKMQRPVRLRPIHSNSTTASLRRSSPYRYRESSNEAEQPFNSTMDKESKRHLTTMELSHGVSPYCLPVINNFVTPVPPATKKKDRGVKMTTSGTVRGRRLHHTNGPDINEESHMLKSSVHQSRVCVSMVYFGKTVHLSHDLTDLRDEVKVFQQHCGGENLCLYRGMLHEGESFQFVSRRHRGFPFSLTFYLNGLQVDRLSSCCEFKHRKGSRLGGRHGHFGFSTVEGASPCYKCIIAMGLDKKPTPPPKRAREDKETVISPKDGAETDKERTDGDAASRAVSPSGQPQDTEIVVKEESPPEEDKVRADYEEDFEADDEGAAEDTEAKEKKSPSLFIESERPVKEERQASETEDDEKDDDRSHSAYSSAGSDGEESDAEATKDSREEEEADQPEDRKEDFHQVDEPESSVPPAEEDEANPEETKATAAKDSDIQDSPRDSTGWTELEVSYSSTPSGKENRGSGDTSGREAEKTIEESKQEEEQVRAKSVQERLAEAILQETQCSSEPELSDTSTEEEEEAAGKDHKQDSKDAVPEKSAAEAQQQQPDTQDLKCEESAVEDQEEGTSETKEQEDETKREPCENSNSYEMGEKDKDVEKAASETDKEEDVKEKDKSEATEEIDTQSVSEEKIAKEENNSEPQDDTANKPAEAEAAEKDGEEEDKSAGEANAERDETGHGAKSSEEDESSASEMKQNTDEPAVVDNAEMEATAGEKVEMKAEPSEEREALSCQEAAVTDTERQADVDTTAGGSETEVKAEHSSSSSKETGDTVVHAEETTGTSEESRKEEPSVGDNKDEVAGGEADEDEGKEEGAQGEEATEKSKETKVEDDKVETEKSEDVKGGDEDTIPEEIPEEKMEKEENIAEVTEDIANVEEKANEEAVEETVEKKDDVVSEEKADETEKTEKDEDGSKAEDSECVKSKDEEESDANRATTDKTEEAEEVTEPNRAADEEKGDEAEKEITGEPEKGAEEEVSEEKENLKISTDSKDSRDNDDQETADEALKETKSEEKESENEKKVSEREGKNDSGEVDAENGEISTTVEKEISVDEAEAPIQEENYVKNEKATEDEPKAEEATEEESIEVKTKTEEPNKMENGEGAEGHEEKCEETDAVEDGGISVDNQQESSQKETSGKEIKEEAGDPHTDGNKAEAEETEQNPEQNTEPKHKDEVDPDSEDINNVKEVTAAASGDQIQVLQHVADGLDSTDHKLDEEEEQPATPHGSEVKMAKNEAGADLSAVEGDNGADIEEASKPSEEGESVLLKPAADSSQLTHNEDSIALVKEVNEEERNDPENHAVTPDVLDQEDNTDLVTNWITKHQTSRFFEKFVEPLEDLKGAQVSNNNTEAAQSTNGTRSESPVKTVKMSEGEAAEKEATEQDEDETEDKTKVEAKHSDLQSNLSKDEEPSENDSTKDKQHPKEEVTNIMSITESEQNGKESSMRQDMRSAEHKGSKGSLKEDAQAQGETEETEDICKTEIENIAGSHLSVASDRPESFTQNHEEENTVETCSDINENQTAIEEIKDVSSSKVEDFDERPKSAEKLAQLASVDMRAGEREDTKETWEKREEEHTEVTEITDFTTAESEDGNQVESQPEPSAGSVSGGKRDLELITDIKHTLSTFSLDSNLLGHSSFPPLTSAQSESSH